MSLAPLPVYWIDASTKYLVALTAGNILLFNNEDGALISALDARVDASVHVDPNSPEVAWAAAPRLCAISKNEEFIAVASDDKMLHVWRPDALEYGREVLLQPLSKRASTMQWTICDLRSMPGQEVVVSDKFGDVWSFPIDNSEPCKKYGPNPPHDPEQLGIRPRLGHVSMITSMAFLGNPEIVPASIITGDRDEHIRISRWGATRASNVVQQYLMGSKSFIGALAIVPRIAAQSVSLSVRRAILSSDGGTTIRIWTDELYEFSLRNVANIDPALIRPYVKLDADVERRREKAAGDCAFKGVFFAEPSGEEPPLVITRLVVVQSSNQFWVMVTWEGATAFAFIPLLAIAMAKESDMLKREDVHIYDVGSPILNTAIVSGSHTTVWIACDDREGFGQGPPLRKYGIEDGKYVPDSRSDPSPLAELTGKPSAIDPTLTAPAATNAKLTALPHVPRALAPPETLSQLCLYSALVTHPKPTSIGLLDNEGAPFAKPLLASSTDAKSKSMIVRQQSGKRAAGRAKNQATILEQYNSQPSR
ncbi:tRNA (guanine-N(7)-)-methyltransferase non-catalytic subunit trm82 [Malassezia vespertilionis]|uniref:Trm82p n=1 Tax=Malassezia vespertilionis TaxID=2020962 RepID=A0A2N1JBY5_9BASI|nr:tRNA (guanine-N(7)-)-methyltransferase non-catalytic subunit trm82 [Malassezia vespertilionis]PKI84071.1 Trm82p [Malassezia vespertilionis]WFD06791.1 tRNA (guanine-N(7)-)-methyltransferase non-catalytic subunit trm82 [Malassezia vespertilionis]